VIAAVLLGAAALVSGRVPAQATYQWALPAGFPPPAIPADNPMTEAKISLGRHLFYDTRLSGSGTQSCASCHDQARAFTDGRARSVGSTGQMHPRGSMSLVNVAYAQALTWANPALTRLEDQALVPMFGLHPVELGLDPGGSWLATLAGDGTYQRLFRAAYNEREPITRDGVVKAIAAFERSIVSARSPYDRYHFDRDDAALSGAAKRGEVLFHSRPLSCFTCHGGIHFSGAMGAPRRTMAIEFHNTGLYNLPGLLSYPAENTGVFDITRNAADLGRFKAPTLRNVAVTAPYMHDGSVATLEEAIDHYAAGGRTIANGPYAGVGRDNPNKSSSIRGFTLAQEQRSDLIAFLRSLTDEALLRDPRFSNPWVRQAGR
jgi:cytochrome c peroxidase